MFRNVLIVDDHPLTRALLTPVLQSFGFEVVAVDSADEAVTVFEDLDPDLLLTDVDLGSRPNGAELATLLSAQSPGLAIVLMSNYPELSQVPGYRSLPPGTRFVSKLDVDKPEILRDVIESALRERPLDSLHSPGTPQGPVSSLTGTQIEVLRLVAEGWSNHEIAHQRGTHVGAIEKVLTRIFRALGVDDNAAINPRVAATREYIRVFGPPTPPSS